MNHVSSRQLTGAGHRCLTNSNRTMRIAFLLYGRPASTSDCPRHTTAKNEVIVRGIHDCVYVLLDQVAGDDHDSRRMHSSTSATRSFNCLCVAFAMPFTPTEEMVIDAHAAPHTSAS